MMTTIQVLREVENKLASAGGQLEGKQAITGFDGFVDSIRKAVRLRDSNGPQYYRTMAEFAQHIKDAAGRSCQIEMDVQRVKMGGNAPILANALGILGIQTLCAGSMGYPQLHPVFQNLSKKCTHASLLAPGESDAIEFADGKLILSDLGPFDEYTWSHIVKTADMDRLRRTAAMCSFIALVDWANLVNASGIWDGFLQDIVKPSGRRDFHFMFDLCDPSKKTSKDINDVLDVISAFTPYGDVTLGLNENETMRIHAALAGVTGKAPSVVDAGRFIHNSMNIEYLLIHPIDRTILFHLKDVIEMRGRLVTKPKIQTGGGDNLNAGYALGRVLDFSLPESMIVGMAASGSYIQEGRSADLHQLISYLAAWRAELESAKATPNPPVN